MTYLTAVHAVANVPRGDGAGGVGGIHVEDGDTRAVLAEHLRGVHGARHLHVGVSRCQRKRDVRAGE